MSTLAALAQARPATLDSGVYASKPIREGEDILPLTGVVVDTPSRHTLQVGADQHLAPLSTDPRDGRSTWCFVNHSCTPNCLVDTTRRVLRAQRAIGAGEELFFDYDTTECNMAEPFACGCGAPACRGTIRGYRYLTPAQQASLKPTLAPHLRGEPAP